MDRATADYMGMLATVMNALAMQGALEKIGIHTRVQSAIPMDAGLRALHPPPRRAPPGEGPGGDLRRRHRQPFFTTDTAAALRAAEMGCEALFKGTQVDGVYTADPKKDPDAPRYDRLSYDEVLPKNLKVMDAAAIALPVTTRCPSSSSRLTSPTGSRGSSGQGPLHQVEPRLTRHGGPGEGGGDV